MVFWPRKSIALETGTEKEGSAESAINGASVPGASKTQETETAFEETEVKLTAEGTEAWSAPVKKAEMNVKKADPLIPLYIIGNNTKQGKVIQHTCDEGHRDCGNVSTQVDRIQESEFRIACE